MGYAALSAKQLLAATVPPGECLDEAYSRAKERCAGTAAQDWQRPFNVPDYCR